ncbi:MAG TPA: zeta toxin family protein [Alloacidobacterium sp.]|nr:zeta toxin family protein [Alloacidobacterium sp.]
MSAPVFIVIAGANGAGKSTLTHSPFPIFSQFPILDPDAIANKIRFSNEQASALLAGREVLQKIEFYLEGKQSFAVETTLSGKNYLRIMADARQRGFRIDLIYIGTRNVEINLARIADRVQSGGHNVPEPDVRRRYGRSFQHLPKACELADVVILFDNSDDEGYQLIGAGDKLGFQWMEPLPKWAVALKAFWRIS